MISFSHKIIAQVKIMKENTSFNMLQLICIIFTINVGMKIEADIYTATSEFVHVLDVHQAIKDYIFLYLKRHAKRLAIIKSYLDIMRREDKRALADIPKYLDNPINLFTLVKRLTIDFNFMKYGNEDYVDYIEYIGSQYYNKRYPQEEDLLGAADALVRLQHMYKLEVKEMAEGKLNGIAYSTPMTACDCYELGRVLYNKSDYWNGNAWMLEAFHKYQKEAIHYSFLEIAIIEYISFGYSKMGDIKSALEWIQKIIDLNPHNSRAQTIAEHCRNKVMDTQYEAVESHIKEMGKRHQKTENIYELQYYALCRGDVKIPIEVSSRLTCRYMKEKHPFLKLAPFKTEMLYLNPDIVMFHDVLSDSEIENVLEMSRGKLIRSGVQSLENTPISSKDRISKSRFLDATQSFAADRISRRVSHMTGLSLESAENMQVANYGIGGFYKMHHDFFFDEVNKDKKIGNRIATVLFYLSNVSQGGATIFARLGLTVFPKKGSAIYWYNLHASGEPNHCLLHAGCPVLQGSKWVSTRWIHESGQEFIKPCNLEYQKEGCTIDYCYSEKTFKNNRTICSV